MKKKLCAILFILVWILSAAAGPVTLRAQAETTEEITDGAETDPSDEKTAFQTFDVRAPKGSVVVVESVGLLDTDPEGIVGETGRREYGPAAFSDGIEAFFSPSPLTYLPIGDYYYTISLSHEKPGTPGVHYDDRVYTVWVHLQYKEGDSSEKRMSIVLQTTDASGAVSHEKPEGIAFVNTKKESKVITRTITYTEETEDGTPMSEVTGEMRFDTVLQKVTLSRTVVCDAEGNPLYDEKGRAIVIGANGNPLVYAADGTPLLANEEGQPVDREGNAAADSGKEHVAATLWTLDESVKNDYAGRTSPEAALYNHIWTGAPAGAANTRDVCVWFDPADPCGEQNPSSDYAAYARKIDLNDPKDVTEHVVYTKKPTHTETETTTVRRVIHYREYNREGDRVYRDAIQEVRLSRTLIVNIDGVVISAGSWQIQSAQGAYGPLTSKEHYGTGQYPKWTHRWDAMDGTADDGMPDVLGWDDASNPNRIDLDSPHDQEEWVIYTPLGSHTETETKTITRTIYYLEYDENGAEVFSPVVQTVTLRRTRTVLSDGTVMDEGDWILAADPADYAFVVSGTRDGWTRDRDVVLGWGDPKNPNRIDLSDPKDCVEYVFYTPARTREHTETKTVTRTITYTEYTPDGREVARPVTQTVTLIRTVITDENGKVISVGAWEIQSPQSDYNAVDSPQKDGWTPNQSRVPVWDIDLADPRDVLVQVVYVPDASDEPVPATIETVEYKTVTRTITYTEYTPDGREVARPVVQTVTLRRVVITDADGNVISIGSWEIAQGDTSAVGSPGRDGWTASMARAYEWDIDLNDPQDVVIHVIYTPRSVAVKTGDENRVLLWLALMGGAALVLLLLPVVRRRKQKRR